MLKRSGVRCACGDVVVTCSDGHEFHSEIYLRQTCDYRKMCTILFEIFEYQVVWQWLNICQTHMCVGRREWMCGFCKNTPSTSLRVCVYYLFRHMHVFSLCVCLCINIVKVI